MVNRASKTTFEDVDAMVEDAAVERATRAALKKCDERMGMGRLCNSTTSSGQTLNCLLH